MKLNNKIIGVNTIKLLQKRKYASQASTKIAGARAGELRKSKFPNGLTVVALENHSPISKIGIFVKAGARWETSDNLGVTHCLRNVAGMSTKNFSIFGITRNMNHRGAIFTASATRDNLIYKIDTNRDESAYNLGFLSDTISRPVFKPWEISDFAYRMKLDVARMNQSPELLLMEDLHKVSFKGGLSNSLYSPDFMIGKHDHNMLMHYTIDNFKSSNIAVVGIGVDQEKLCDLIESSFTFDDRHADPTPESKFVGGESRRINDSDVCFAAVTCEGAGANNLKDVVAISLMQTVLGNGSRMKYGSGGDKLSVAVGKVAENPFAISALNVSHADSGLFGFTLAGSAEEMHTLVKAAVTKMKETVKNVTEDEIKNAKKVLKTTLNMYFENGDNILDELGSQEINSGKLFDFNEMENSIDSISVQDVKEALGKKMKGKGAMASIGKLDNMPHLGELSQ